MLRFSRLLAVGLLALPLGSSAMELEEVLQRYVGRWSGHFTIHSPATGYSVTFPVEQQYWMSGKRLLGVAVTDRDGRLESAKSVTVIEDGKLISRITRGEKGEVYVGVLHDDSVLWISEDMQRANDYQMKESILVEEGELRLKTEGFDTYVYQEGLAHIVVRGNLRFDP